MCSPGWDHNCGGFSFTENENCDFSTTGPAGIVMSIPWYMDGRCQYSKVFDSSFIIADGEVQFFEQIQDCEGESSVINTEYAQAEGFDGDCFTFDTEEEEDGQVETFEWSGQWNGIYDPNYQLDPLWTCADGNACGPEACDPLTDELCVVFTVYADSDACQVVDMDAWESVGDYHAFAIADNVCHMDGSGRSFYKIQVADDLESGEGILGCTDSGCSENCVSLAMTVGECETPDWANGLTLTANFVSDSITSEMLQGATDGNGNPEDCSWCDGSGAPDEIGDGSSLVVLSFFVTGSVALFQ
jgi:hypothetical protein